MEDLKIVHEFTEVQINQLVDLYKKMWWSKDRTKEEVLTLLKTSVSFGLICDITQKLVGYARVLTDEIKYAFIFDVMLQEPFRKKGLGKTLMNAIITYPKFERITRFELTCVPDLVTFYEQFGFSENYGEVRAMRFRRD